MGLDIFTAEDIANGILAVEESSQRTALMAQYTDAELNAYRRGVQDGLTSLGLVFGITDLPFPAPRLAPGQNQQRVLARRR